MTNSSVKGEDLSSGYGKKLVLEKINFSIENNEFVGVIGPNASGKSTLLRTIDRVLEPEGGKVFLEGEDMEKLEKKEIAKKMSVVPQEFSANYSFSVLEIVTLGRTPHLGPLEMEDEEDMEKVKGAMEITNTLELADRSFSELSGGEKQRVIIAKALAQEPSVLLLDEPINHLDINNQLEILDLVKSLTKEGKQTVIATFHNLNTAARYCDKLILIKDGKIYDQGVPESVLNEKNIREVYGSEVSVRHLPETNSVSIIPLSGSFGRERKTGSEEKIHLICGGGSGKTLMHSLTQNGFRVSTGVLSRLDDDCREARKLGLEIVEESPFLPISDSAAEKNLELMKDSDLIIMTNMPIGKGNLRNLELVEEIAEKKPVLVIEENPMEKRDFTEGKAEKIHEKLKEKSIENVESIKEAIKFIENEDFRYEGND